MHFIIIFWLICHLDLPGGLNENGDINLKEIELLINGLTPDKYHSVSQCDTRSGSLERYYLKLYQSLGGYYRNTGEIIKFSLYNKVLTMLCI